MPPEAPQDHRASTTTTDDLFRALADPTRRRNLDLLAERGTATVSELAQQFPDLVASGISKHLMALRAAEWVIASKRGRNQIYAIDADTMEQVLGPWLATYQTYWTGALTRLRDAASGPPAEPSEATGQTRATS